MKYLIIYFTVISLFTVVITAYDKFASKYISAARISERFLLLSALAGGAAAMYITMKIIRHKTKHKKFMIGLPVMILLHTVVFVIILNA